MAQTEKTFPKEDHMPETATKAAAIDGPPQFLSFSHVSVPCRDLEEGIRFYTEVLGGKVRVKEPHFASIRIAGADVGIGAEGCSYVERGAEYPHFAFFAGGEQMLQMKEWLTRCGIPSTNFWTRGGVEALMFFRDPSGNLIELYCQNGFKGADKLPRGPARGHGKAVNVDDLYYEKWQLPARR
jgi:catechol 2,3-dioxygenase-like lactoylglutathione lyase family enzyme